MAVFSGGIGSDTITPGFVSAGMTRNPVNSFPTSGHDIILGGGGDDVIDGGVGPDQIDGGGQRHHHGPWDRPLRWRLQAAKSIAVLVGITKLSANDFAFI